MDDLIDFIVANLADYQGWQENLTEDERDVLLDTARNCLRAILRVERTRLVDAFVKVNACMSEAGEGSARADLFQAVLSAVGVAGGETAHPDR